MHLQSVTGCSPGLAKAVPVHAGIAEREWLRGGVVAPPWTPPLTVGRILPH